MVVKSMSLGSVHWKMHGGRQGLYEKEVGGDSEEDGEPNTTKLLLENRQNVAPPGIGDALCGRNKTFSSKNPASNVEIKKVS